MRFRFLRVVAAAALTAGLVTTTQPASARARSEWVARKLSDQFSDQAWCRVESRGVENSKLMPVFGLRPQALRFPYVERRGDQLRVGIISAGGIPLPTGEVQLRVDQHPAQTIGPSETPVDGSSPGAQVAAAQMQSMAAADPERAALYAAAAESAARNFNGMMSPYTATTGEKAKLILDQMRGGQQMIFRGVGANMAATTTGKITLDDSFRKALAECGL